MVFEISTPLKYKEHSRVPPWKLQNSSTRILVKTQPLSLLGISDLSFRFCLRRTPNALFDIRIGDISPPIKPIKSHIHGEGLTRLPNLMMVISSIKNDIDELFYECYIKNIFQGP